MTRQAAEPLPLRVSPVRWPEVTRGDDLAALVLASVELVDGDVLVLTSKVVSKAEGRAVGVDRVVLVDQETRRVVARRGLLTIAETRHGLVMAAAGVDSSNAAPGTALALPVDPDGTAKALREQLMRQTGRNVAVVISDTAGRAWRLGQTDIAIGCAGLDPLVSMAGSTDPYGNELRVTAPAIADEVASAGELVKGKTSGCPLAVVRGLSHLVLPPGDPGPGAAALVRPGADDLFALGARDAAVAATLRDDQAALASFTRLADDDVEPFAGLRAPDSMVLEVTAVIVAEQRGWSVQVSVLTEAGPTQWLAAGAVVERVYALAAAHRLLPFAPPPAPVTHLGTRPDAFTVAHRSCWVTS